MAKKKMKVVGLEKVLKHLDIPEEDKKKLREEVMEKLGNFDPENPPAEIRKIVSLPSGSKFCPRDGSPLKQVGKPFRWRDRDTGEPEGGPIVPMECEKCTDLGFYVSGAQ